MAATPSTLRPGEAIRLTGTPLDAQGQSIAALNPSWTQLGTPDDIVSLVPDEENQLEAVITGIASGSDSVTLAAEDFLLDPVAASQPITVLDAAGFLWRISNPVACAILPVRETQGSQTYTYHVTPEGEATATFELTLFVVDSRSLAGDHTGAPTYALSDGPNLTTDTQRILFGESPGPTSSDDATVLCTIAGGGVEVIHIAGVTDATSAPITASINFRIRALTSISLAYAPEPA